ncbi:MAG: autotransporter domain-containing protein [Methylobacterium sp.]|nr:autotransporter domain-containing protein [Methylobacterium sp.]MCA3616392.1 autotransporter domain-containing protein [Methylobacterium sp.]MCA3640651.1 autotransporter domain-containing protein [Methylobacterium sp.]
MIKGKASAGLLALATVLLAGTAQAQAPRYVTFGDSLSDIGNLFAATGMPPPPYFNGRFSNGRTFVEYLSPGQAGWTGGLTPAGSVNFAFGGARTDNAVALPPGTVTQIGTFLAGGGTFGATDIVTLWAGANNIFQGIAVPANQNTAAMGAIASGAANDVVNQVNTLAGAGARTIVVLSLPDIGLAPNFNTSPASPLASFSTSTFNATLKNGLAAVVAARPGTRVLQVNVAGLFSAAIANPGAFGFANVTNQCLTTVACVTATQAVQNTYLFWDGVHPTTAGHALVANAVSQYLNAPDRALSAAAITEIAVQDRRMAASRALDRISEYRPDAGKTDVFISIIGEQANVGARGAMRGYSVGAAGLEFGFIRHLTDQTSMGLSLSAKTGEASASAYGNKVTMQPTTFAADVMARWSRGSGLFVQGAIGGSITRIGEFERHLNIGNLQNKGSTTAHGYSAIAQAGYAMPMGNMIVTPSARFGYLFGQMQAFSENGVIAPLAYSSRSVSTFLLAGEVKTKFALSQTLAAHTVFGYEAFLGQTGSSLKGYIADSPGSNFAARAGRIESPGFLFGAGLSGTINGVQTSFDYRGSVGSGGKLQHRASLSGKIGF